MISGRGVAGEERMLKSVKSFLAVNTLPGDGQSAGAGIRRWQLLQATMTGQRISECYWANVRRIHSEQRVCGYL